MPQTFTSQPAPHSPPSHTALAAYSSWRLRGVVAGFHCCYFALLYNLTNHAALASSVQFSFANAFRMPFVPSAIWIYLASAPLFLISFLIKSTPQQLRLQHLRTLWASSIACLLFAIFPIQMADRTALWQAAGLDHSFWPTLYGTLLQFDLPYNQLPSLHVTYALLLWPISSRIANRGLRVLGRSFLLLLCASAVLTYQHHLFDAIAGALLAIALCLVVRQTNTAVAVATHYLALVLAIGAVAISAHRLWDWNSVVLTILVSYLAWSLIGVANAYLRLQHGFLGKMQGRFPWLSLLRYAPYLLGYRLTLYCQRWRGIGQLRLAAPGLWQSGQWLAADSARLAGWRQQHQPLAVLDLANESPEATALLSARYLHLPVLDLLTLDQAQMQTALGFIAQAQQAGCQVLVHCTIGLSRSQQVVQAWLNAATPVSSAP